LHDLIVRLLKVVRKIRGEKAMNEIEAIGICVIVILTLFGIWLFGILGLFIFLLMSFGFIVLLKLYKKYFEEEKPKPRHQLNWQCSYCLRINSAKAKICTKCGKERRRILKSDKNAESK